MGPFRLVVGPEAAASVSEQRREVQPSALGAVPLRKASSKARGPGVGECCPEYFLVVGEGLVE